METKAMPYETKASIAVNAKFAADYCVGEAILEAAKLKRPPLLARMLPGWLHSWLGNASVSACDGTVASEKEEKRKTWKASLLSLLLFLFSGLAFCIALAGMQKSSPGIREVASATSWFVSSLVEIPERRELNRLLKNTLGSGYNPETVSIGMRPIIVGDLMSLGFFERRKAIEEIDLAFSTLSGEENREKRVLALNDIMREHDKFNPMLNALALSIRAGDPSCKGCWEVLRRHQEIGGAGIHGGVPLPDYIMSR